jgi:hypothetical protein
MSTPFVSCVCLTYNRAPDHLWLLGEAVESYLRQDYPVDCRELIVLNDTPGQEVVVEGAAEGVRVVNLPIHFRTLGEKYLAAMGLARGEVLMWWDDDDISLPWRVRHSVEQLNGCDYYNPKGYWFWGPGGLVIPAAHGCCFNCSAFTRKAYERAGVLGFGIDFDQQMHHALSRHNGTKVASGTGKPEEWSYIYRWGISNAHLSGWGMEAGPDEVPGTRGYAESGKRPIVGGQFEVRPRWRDDYVCYVYGRLEQLSREKNPVIT